VSTDYDKIAKIEQAIKKKYGEEAIKNPLSDWGQDKEKEYIEQVKKVSQIEKSKTKSEKEEYNGFLIDKKLLTRDNKRACPVCAHYSFNVRDDVYFSKWDCCRECFIRWVEGREERWTQGWRPKIENEDGKRESGRVDEDGISS
jgi:hypothetical protein